MSIIISKQGKNARRLQRTSIQQEEYLQAYVHNNPDVLPLDELKDNLRLLILAREFNTASGPIDALGVDAEGEFTSLKRSWTKMLIDGGSSHKRLIMVLRFGPVPKY
jgi:RecB family endonuclease NucS